MAVNWSILANAPDPGNAFTQGFQSGQQQRREYESRNALSRLVQHPNDTAALGTLARFSPETALQYQQHQEDRADKNLDRQIKLSEAQRKQFEERVKTIGGLAQLADTPQKWDAGIDQLVQMGHPEFAEYKGRFSPELRMSAIAASHQALDWLKATAPQYQTAQGVGVVQLPSLIGQGGVSVNGQPQEQPSAQVPPAAVDYLRQNPHLKAEFDAKYGQGAADHILGGAGPQTPQPFP